MMFEMALRQTMLMYKSDERHGHAYSRSVHSPDGDIRVAVWSYTEEKGGVD